MCKLLDLTVQGSWQEIFDTCTREHWFWVPLFCPVTKTTCPPGHRSEINLVRTRLIGKDRSHPIELGPHSKLMVAEKFALLVPVRKNLSARHVILVHVYVRPSIAIAIDQHHYTSKMRTFSIMNPSIFNTTVCFYAQTDLRSRSLMRLGRNVLNWF